MNSALAQHAITMLTICYIPGLFAAFIQLKRGTKYSRFPSWLDKWLRMRKQIGLLMLFSASLHVSIFEIWRVFSTQRDPINMDLKEQCSLFFNSW